MKKVIPVSVLLFLIFTGCKEGGNISFEEKIGEQYKYSFPQAKFELAKLSASNGFIAAVDRGDNPGLFLIDPITEEINKIFDGNVTEFVFADENLAFISAAYSPERNYSLYMYNLADSTVTKIIERSKRLRFLSFIDDKLLVLFNRVIRQIDKNLCDVETAIPAGYFYFEDKRLTLFEENSRPLKIDLDDDIIWADYKHGVPVVYLKNSGIRFGTLNTKTDLMLSSPKLSAGAKYLAGYSEFYEGEKMVSSKSFLFELNDGSFLEKNEFENLRNPVFDFSGNYLILTDYNGSIIIKKIKRDK